MKRACSVTRHLLSIARHFALVTRHTPLVTFSSIRFHSSALSLSFAAAESLEHDLNNLLNSFLEVC